MTEVIQPGEAFICIPNHLLITVEKALASELQEYYRKHEDIYLNDIGQRFLILVVYLIHERLKGDKSFYHAYFEAVEPGTHTNFWPSKILDQVECPEFHRGLQ